MEPKVLVPPSFTDSDGTIERVVAAPGAGGREFWDSSKRAWVPSGRVTESALHGRALSPAELSKAGIPAG